MRFFTDSYFISASHRLVSTLQPRSRKPGDSDAARQAAAPFSIARFDTDSERQFWQERRLETISTLKTAIILGITAFLAFIVVDLLNGGLTDFQIASRSFMVLLLAVLLLRLRTHPQPETQIPSVAKISAGMSVVNLIGMMWYANNPDFYTTTCAGLLPIYFFTYGQLFLKISETLMFGLLTMFALPLAGYMIGMEVMALMPSIIILSVVNAFGFCTRYQLESHSRTSFRARRKAEIATEDKTQFVRQLSHNLRQPLQALSCYASVLDAVCKNESGDRIRPVVYKLGSAIDELNNGFNHILDIIDLETGKQRPTLTAVNINALLASLDVQFAPQAAKRGLKLIIRQRNRPPYSILSDAAILAQIIGNLIDNAIKYTVNGWVLVDTVKIGGNRLKLHVRDTGIGMAEPQQRNIFEDFYRGHRRREDPRVHGLGIGLTYVRKAVDRLPDHTLKLYSKLNLGSDFQLSFPVATESPDCHCRSDITNNRLDGKLIVIVDDDQEVLDALADQLTGWGCLVQKAGSKTEMYGLLTDNVRAPDLLITDFYLHNNETAHDIIAALTADCGPVPTLILSAHAIPAEDKAKWPGNTLLLRKPASAAVLLETVVKAVRQTAA